MGGAVSSQQENKKPAVSEAPKVVPYDVRVFAILRNGHEGLRGLLKTLAERATDCVAKPDAESAVTVNQAWENFQVMLKCHMDMEDKVVFPMMDKLFDNIVSNDHLDEEHECDKKLMAETTAAIGALTFNPSLETAKAALDLVLKYQRHHEEHLLHEETLLMPKTVIVNPPEIRPAILHHAMNLDFALTVKSMPLTVAEMAHRNPFASLRMLVLAVQRVLTPEQYAQILPGIKDAAGDLWPKLEREGVAKPGRFSDSDIAVWQAAGAP
eukprot:INCI10567.1.p1 GENE.INCI10567.1~~INCI10567.1.p1  ORF type:complete len:268 (-),score=56.17 INCI10567.1:142-945(-)